MQLLHMSHVKYGLIMTGIVILCLALMEATGQNKSFDKSPAVFIWTFIAPALVWFYGIKARKAANKNKLTLKQGVTEGFKISLVFAITSPFVFAAYYSLVNQDIVNYVRTSYGLTNQPATTVIALDMIAQFFSAIVFGLIYASVISFFLKTKSKKGK